MQIEPLILDKERSNKKTRTVLEKTWLSAFNKEKGLKSEGLS